VKGSGLIVVGRAYGVAETAMAVALLDACGIKVLAPLWYTASVQWHWTQALGGIEICVPVSQAESALEILAELRVSRRPTTCLWRRLVLLAFFVGAFFVAGFPPPPSGFYAAASRAASPRAPAPHPIPT